MPFFCQYCVLFGQFECLKMKKNQYQNNFRYTGAGMASFCICAYLKLDLLTSNVIENDYKNPRNNNKLCLKLAFDGL